METYLSLLLGYKSFTIIVSLDYQKQVFTMFKSFNQQYYGIIETFIFIMHLFGQ